MTFLLDDSRDSFVKSEQFCILSAPFHMRNEKDRNLY